MSRFLMLLLLCAAPALAAPDYEPWWTLGYGRDDTRTGAMACTNDHPSITCMHVGCARGGSLLLSFTDLGMVRDLKSDPAGPKRTKVTLTFPDGTGFILPARRVPVRGRGYNQVEVPGWTDSRVQEAFKAIGDGEEGSFITATLPDGRSSKFSTRNMNFAIGQAPSLCAE